MEAPAARPDGAATPSALAGLLRPIVAFRSSYVPVVMVFFAYGALGLIDVTRDLWIKESLSLSPHNSRGSASGSHCLGP